MLTTITHLLCSTLLVRCVSADIMDMIKYKVELAVSAIVGEKRALYYGWHDSQGHSFSDAIGNRDRDEKVKAEVTDQVPAGSLAKSYVATAIMSLVDQGKLDIDDKVMKLLDPWLEKYMNLSLSSVFTGPNIENVTVRELLHMTAGLADYDDNYVWALSVYTNYDLTPFIYLTTPAIFTPSWFFAPGEGLAYSSIGYVLAGMVLASMMDKPWNEVMASDFFSQEFMNASKGFQMTGQGLCSQYEHIPHTYSFNRTLYNTSNPSDPYPTWISKRSYFTDMYNHSCLNGWMFGNLITTAWDSAYYMFSLFSPNATTPLVSSASLDQITDFELATSGWGPSISLNYGLGSMKVDLQSIFKTKTATPDEYRYWVGHAGIDYGSAGFGVYIPGMDAGFNIMWNSGPGSLLERDTYAYAICKTMVIVLNSLMPSDGPEAHCGLSVEEFKGMDHEWLFALMYEHTSPSNPM